MEVARIVLRSGLVDVMSVRARWTGSRYRYRVVDEYNMEFRFCRETSVRTLTFSQLIELIETAEREEWGLRGEGLVEYWWNAIRDRGGDPASCTKFAYVESEQYPALSEYFGWRAEAWRLDFSIERKEQGFGPHQRQAAESSND